MERAALWAARTSCSKEPPAGEAAGASGAVLEVVVGAAEGVITGGEVVGEVVGVGVGVTVELEISVVGGGGGGLVEEVELEERALG